MTLKVKTTNKHLFDVLNQLRKASSKNPSFKRVYDLLNASKRRRGQVNLWKIEKVAKEGSTVVIPGKLLSQGVLNKKVTVVAYNASEIALTKLKDSPATFISLEEFLSKPSKNFTVIY